MTAAESFDEAPSSRAAWAQQIADRHRADPGRVFTLVELAAVCVHNDSFAATGLADRYLRSASGVVEVAARRLLAQAGSATLREHRGDGTTIKVRVPLGTGVENIRVRGGEPVYWNHKPARVGAVLGAKNAGAWVDVWCKLTAPDVVDAVVFSEASASPALRRHNGELVEMSLCAAGHNALAGVDVTLERPPATLPTPPPPAGSRTIGQVRLIPGGHHPAGGRLPDRQEVGQWDGQLGRYRFPSDAGGLWQYR